MKKQLVAAAVTTAVGVALLGGGYGLYRYSFPDSTSSERQGQAVVSETRTGASPKVAPASSPTPGATPAQVSTLTPAPTGKATPLATIKPQPSPAKPSREQVQQQVSKHISQARALYNQRQYQAALRECNKALSLDPKNQEALRLRDQINGTIRVLGKERSTPYKYE